MIAAKIMAACSAAAVLSFTMSPAHADDASMFRGNARHTGIYPKVGERLAGVKWTFHTGGPVNSSPALAGGAVFFGSSDGFLYSVDAATGKLRWKYETGSRVPSSPAVSGGTVYVLSYDDYFYAIDASDGHVRWKFKTGGEHRFEAPHLHGTLPLSEVMPDPFDVFLSSPVISGALVYFGSSDGWVYALDAGTGALRWRFKTAGVVHATPAIDRDSLYVGSWDSYFYALNARTGKLRWRFKTGDDPVIHNQVGIASSAAVANGTVFFGCRDSHLYALDAATGALRWAIPTHGSWVIASPAVQDGLVYFATSDSGLFLAADAHNGKVLISIDFKHWPMFSSPSIAGGIAFIGSHTGKLIAIDLADRRVAWQFATPAAIKYLPTYTNPDGTPNYGLAYPGNFYDDLVVGAARLMTVGAVLSTPAVGNGAVYFGSNDGNLYALAVRDARAALRR